MASTIYIHQNIYYEALLFKEFEMSIIYDHISLNFIKLEG